MAPLTLVLVVALATAPVPLDLGIARFVPQGFGLTSEHQQLTPHMVSPTQNVRPITKPAPLAHADPPARAPRAGTPQAETRRTPPPSDAAMRRLAFLQVRRI